jgi:hypothetical protein
LGIEDLIGMGVEPCAVAAGDVEEEKFGNEGVGGDMGSAEEVDALFQGSADVRGFGLFGGHGFIHKRRV